MRLALQFIAEAGCDLPILDVIDTAQRTVEAVDIAGLSGVDLVVRLAALIANGEERGLHRHGEFGVRNADATDFSLVSGVHVALAVAEFEHGLAVDGEVVEDESGFRAS